MIRFLKKYHKWIGVVITLTLLLFATSGIVLNHRELFSSIDVSRKYLPENYRFKNWNLASVKKSTIVGKDSFLVYGNIGIWLSDKNFTKFKNFNQGLPKGADNKKTSSICKTKKGELFAGTLFGLYHRNKPKQQWEKVSLPLHNEHIVDIIEKNDTLLVLSRSFLLSSTDGENFSKHQLPHSKEQSNKVSLFKTLWTIHSGEIFGTSGKIVVDIIAVIFIFLCITGLILFINSYRIKNKKKRHKKYTRLRKVNRWNLNWHNKIGWITLILLTITTLTGIFLRPPFLIAIASSEVNKIPFTTLDNDNHWFDKLRMIHYNEDKKIYIVGTNSDIYYTNDIFKTPLKSFNQNVPVSVMGINVFEQKNADEFLIGSFEGLFLWNSQTGKITDYITKQPYKKPERKGPPVGNYLVSGYIADFKGNECFFEYSKGLCSMNGTPLKKQMPEKIRTQPISLWNLMLEIHTGRIFQSVLSIFYILIVPLTGLLTLFVLISGFIVWFKHYHKKSKLPHKR